MKRLLFALCASMIFMAPSSYATSKATSAAASAVLSWIKGHKHFVLGPGYDEKDRLFNRELRRNGITPHQQNKAMILREFYKRN